MVRMDHFGLGDTVPYYYPDENSASIDYDAMQFTGLLDKNGKEIYEGDILRIANVKEEWKHGEPPFDWRVLEVVWNKCNFAFNNSVLYMPFTDYDRQTLEPYELEVIGNIYENPDLLSRA